MKLPAIGINLLSQKFAAEVMGSSIICEKFTSVDENRRKILQFMDTCPKNIFRDANLCDLTLLDTFHRTDNHKVEKEIKLVLDRLLKEMKGGV